MFVFAPLLAALAWMVFRMVGKAWWPLVACCLPARVYYIVNGRSWAHRLAGGKRTRRTQRSIYFLLWLFGRTLLPGREPLISQISRRINGELMPKVVAYTRHVTIAWCIFFTLQVVFRCCLYIFAPLAAWSFFINVLNLPLLLLMFVGEKTYRTARFPNHPQTSILKAIEVYSKDFAAPKKADSER